MNQNEQEPFETRMAEVVRLLESLLADIVKADSLLAMSGVKVKVDLTFAQAISLLGVKAPDVEIPAEVLKYLDGNFKVH